MALRVGGGGGSGGVGVAGSAAVVVLAVELVVLAVVVSDGGSSSTIINSSGYKISRGVQCGQNAAGVEQTCRQLVCAGGSRSVGQKASAISKGFLVFRRLAK